MFPNYYISALSWLTKSTSKQKGNKTETWLWNICGFTGIYLMFTQLNVSQWSAQTMLDDNKIIKFKIRGSELKFN